MNESITGKIAELLVSATSDKRAKYSEFLTRLLADKNVSEDLVELVFSNSDNITEMMADEFLTLFNRNADSAWYAFTLRVNEEKGGLSDEWVSAINKSFDEKIPVETCENALYDVPNAKDFLDRIEGGSDLETEELHNDGSSEILQSVNALAELVKGVRLEVSAMRERLDSITEVKVKDEKALAEKDRELNVLRDKISDAEAEIAGLKVKDEKALAEKDRELNVLRDKISDAEAEIAGYKKIADAVDTFKRALDGGNAIVNETSVVNSEDNAAEKEDIVDEPVSEPEPEPILDPFPEPERVLTDEQTQSHETEILKESLAIPSKEPGDYEEMASDKVNIGVDDANEVPFADDFEQQDEPDFDEPEPFTESAVDISEDEFNSYGHGKQYAKCALKLVKRNFSEKVKEAVKNKEKDNNESLYELYAMLCDENVTDEDILNYEAER